MPLEKESIFPMHKYLLPVQAAFHKAADKEKAAGMSAYMLNQFPFFGIPTPERRKICRTHYRQYPVTDAGELNMIVRACFEQNEREYHYFGIELFAFHHKLWQPGLLPLLDFALTTHSWWDSVDHIASDWLSRWFRLYPDQVIPVTERWNRSKNIWLQRSSILFQKKYKKTTDTELLSRYILHCAASKEFFIRKGIGWALREYGKSNPLWVRAFVKKHTTILSPLSVREALKRL
jgi:3-methyladenine DNA glycosylase AlkD